MQCLYYTDLNTLKNNFIKCLRDTFNLYITNYRFLPINTIIQTKNNIYLNKVGAIAVNIVLLSCWTLIYLLCRCIAKNRTRQCVGINFRLL